MMEKVKEINLNGFFVEFERLVPNEYLDSKDFELFLKKEDILKAWKICLDDAIKHDRPPILISVIPYVHTSFESLMRLMFVSNEPRFFEIIPKILEDYIRWNYNKKEKKEELDFTLLFEEMEKIWDEKKFIDIKTKIEKLIGKSEPENPLNPKLKDTESKLKDTESKLKDTESKLKDTESKLKDTESKLKDTESKLKDTESKLKDTESKLKDTGFLSKNAKSKNILLKIWDFLWEETTQWKIPKLLVIILVALLLIIIYKITFKWDESFEFIKNLSIIYSSLS
ncbi:hypothetical protein [Methanococcus maripaludis]|nr:hypothetical protein [Methanococcus maripaludis]